MAQYGLETEVTTHLKGMSFGDSQPETGGGGSGAPKIMSVVRNGNDLKIHGFDESNLYFYDGEELEGSWISAGANKVIIALTDILDKYDAVLFNLNYSSFAIYDANGWYGGVSDKQNKVAIVVAKDFETANDNFRLKSNFEHINLANYCTPLTGAKMGSAGITNFFIVNFSDM